MRYIICAAVKHNGKLYLGKCHGDIIQNMHKDNLVSYKIRQYEQGFVDNYAEFYDRTTAAMVARIAGQTRIEIGERLTSEDIQQKLWQLNELKGEDE